MKRIWKGSALLLAVVAFAATLVGGAAAAGEMTYSVTITNSTSGQPFAPAIVVAHTDAVSVFALEEKASVGVQTIAETGDPGPLAATLAGVAGVLDVKTFGAPIFPGTSVTLEIQAPAGSYLSVVGMLICTNDAFTGVSSMMLPAMGMATVQAMAYDAGTELNSELTVDLPDPCGAAGPVAFDANGNGRTGTSANITLHTGIAGIGDLTVADHGWTGSVATIDVVAVGSPSAPSTGNAGLRAEGGSGQSYLWLVIGGAVLALAGTAFAGSRRVGSRA